jgi:CspA family cold shock protein
MHTGTVETYDGKKGFGFIMPSNGSHRIHVYISALDRAGLGGLVKGQELRFDIETDSHGRKVAANLRVIRTTPAVSNSKKIIQSM